MLFNQQKKLLTILCELNKCAFNGRERERERGREREKERARERGRDRKRE